MPPLTDPQEGRRWQPSQPGSGSSRQRARSPSEVDLTGRRIVVTGGASGIGIETARALAGAGADVTLAVRNTEAGDHIAVEIAASEGQRQRPRAPPRSRRSRVGRRVRRGVARTAARARQQRRSDGVARAAHERGLGAAVRDQPPRPLRARAGLHKALAAAGDARIVVGQLERAPALAGRLRGHPLRAAPVRPLAGLRAVEDGQRALRRRGDEALGERRHRGQRAHARRDPHQPAALRRERRGDAGRWARAEREADFWKSTEQGAATSVLLATSPLLAGIGGRYFEDCNEAAVDDSDGRAMPACAPTRSTRGGDPPLGRLAELLETPVGAAR